MISSLVERSLTGLISIVLRAKPSFGQRIIARLMSQLPKDHVLSETLKMFPIESIEVRGDQGLFEGSADDVSVIQRYAIDRHWSPKTVKRLVDYFASQGGTGTYVDIGANIGLTAIPIAASGVNVLAFEPVPKNYKLLVRNAATNGAQRSLQTFPIALLDQPGSVTFELSPSNHGDHRYRKDSELAEMGENQWKTVSVTAETLDGFLDKITTPLVLKIDTQGAEPLVISGGTKVCELASMVIAEYSPYAMSRMGTDPTSMIDYLSNFGPVEIYEREEEHKHVVLAGKDLSEFLWNYYRQNDKSPMGRYLNLIGSRD